MPNISVKVRSIQKLLSVQTETHTRLIAQLKHFNVVRNDTVKFLTHTSPVTD